MTHYLATSGPASLIASCQGSAAAPKLVLSVTGGTQTLAYTAAEVSSDTSAAPVTALVHGTTTVLGSSVVDTETTAGNLSDLVTLAINAEDGTQITGTLDLELNTAAGSPACTVNGTIASA